MIRIAESSECGALLSTVLHEARDSVAAEAAERSLVITVVPAFGSAAVERTRVVQVLGLLLRSALRSVAAGGRVALTAHESERNLVFTVYSAAVAARSILVDQAEELAGSFGGRLVEARAGSGTVAVLTIAR